MSYYGALGTIILILTAFMVLCLLVGHGADIEQRERRRRQKQRDAALINYETDRRFR